MFSFHKPKIYRSNLGCCICKAKSSSSRFTDSKKYENEFERCFRIEEARSGEICNACVLLVKRWKKLSPENRLTKHWHHVVDARAGPGTKLTSGRRFTGSQQNHNTTSQQDSSSSSSSSCSSSQSVASNQQVKHQRQYSSSSGGGGGSTSRLVDRDASAGPLPLSSSQSANQSGAGQLSSNCSNASRRASSFSSKARAIDTNVSTFTFGEPLRRSYMATESSFSAASSSSALHKPQSALNSSAFESVIKRFRQRQQQQKLEAQRRLLSRQQRLNRQAAHQQQTASASNGEQADSNCRQQNKRTNLKPEQQVSEETSSSQEDSNGPISSPSSAPPPPPNKRVKRSSESIGSLCVDGLRVSSLLDGSIWRKEKICCGIIFRGLHNEVVVFPKLLKPCQCRQQRLKRQLPDHHQQQMVDVEEQRSSPSPPSRATKSGSISSCDSNTSGTGSMEPTPAEPTQLQLPISCQKPRRQKTPAPKTLDSHSLEWSPSTTATTFDKRPRSTRASRRQQEQLPERKSGGNQADTDSIISTSSSSVLSPSAEFKDSNSSLITTVISHQQQVHSPSSSTSGASSSQLLLMANEDEDLEDEEDDEEDVESNNTDASSSLDSLAEVERKKSPAGGNPVGAMG